MGRFIGITEMPKGPKGDHDYHCLGTMQTPKELKNSFHENDIYEEIYHYCKCFVCRRGQFIKLKGVPISLTAFGKLFVINDTSKF